MTMKKTQLALVLVGIAALALGGTAIAAKGHSTSKRAVWTARGDAHHGPGDDLARRGLVPRHDDGALVTQLQSGKTLARSQPRRAASRRRA